MTDVFPQDIEIAEQESVPKAKENRLVHPEIKSVTEDADGVLTFRFGESDEATDNAPESKQSQKAESRPRNESGKGA